MTEVLLATDADWLFDEVSASLCEPGVTVSRIRDGRDLAQAAKQLSPDLVILDLQVGTKGGVASSIDLGHDIATGRAPATRIMLLLDRDADRWLARHANADGWLIKPLDAFRLRKTASRILAGEQVFEGEPVADSDAANEADTELTDTELTETAPVS